MVRCFAQRSLEPSWPPGNVGVSLAMLRGSPFGPLGLPLVECHSKTRHPEHLRDDALF